jgi:preprotein translocase subunit YajC
MPTATAFFAPALVAATKAKTSTGSSVASILFLAVIFALVYFLFLRPRTMAARRQRDTLMELSAGEEVLTGAGIFGTVLDVEADRVTLETAPGTRITVLRSTISRRITDPGVSSVAEQNWNDQAEHDQAGYGEPGHDQAGHDHMGYDQAGHDEADDHGHEGHDGDEPQADGAAGTGQGGGR